MDIFKIKPKPGVILLDPQTMTKLKPSGEVKPKNTYWLRRVADGDAIEIKPTNTNKKENKK